ncbi:glycosyltransferase family 39 protein [Weizmannia acidilactici]|uniref:glycosyltransferase family 39 protein n=1 Tax=Weizmannia acidilactici TaxID=2607726 RepID=UPI00124F5ADB|nr:glycosyltransferase family 39 protein [Weizmannia acidilactici]GER72696.1 mannosyltransferase [Weizmannia acidilactici]
MISKWKNRIDCWLAAILAFSAVLNFYNLQNAGSNEYYTVAVKSMMKSFHAFFYASFDPAGFITVDKPPVALWIQVLSAKIFGLSDWSVLFPEALAGVLSVWLMYVIVKPKFGRTAALVSSLVLACSPIFVAVVRTNNVDSILILTLLIAAWALMKAADQAEFRYLLLSMALVGVGFNIKMLQAYMVLLAVYLFYLVAAKVNWKKKILHLASATVILAVVSLSWAVVVDSIPASKRPYIGSSQTNSVLELAFGYNGIQRLTGNQSGGNKANADKALTSAQNSSQSSSSTAQNGNSGTNAQRNMPQMRNGQTGGMFGTGTPSIFRLFQSELSGQISWLMPFVLMTMVALVVSWRKTRKFTMQHKFALFWLAWLLPMMAFFSVAQFFHQYYLSMMGPAIAALVGIGWTLLWDFYQNEKDWKNWLLPAGVLATFLFEALILYQNKDSIDSIWIFCTIMAGFVLAVLLAMKHQPKTARIFGMLSLVGMLAMPFYWTVLTIGKTNNASTPIAGPGSASFGKGMAMARDGNVQEPGGMAGGSFNGDMSNRGHMQPPNFGSSLNQDAGTPPTGNASQAKQGNFGERQVNTKLLSYLKMHYNGETYFLATESAQTAEAYMLKTDYAVMAMGGFSGSDPALTPEKLEKMVKSGKVKYFLISGNDFRMGGSQSSVTNWIKTHCKKVPESEWKDSSNSQTNFGGHFGGIETLYVYEG